MNTSAPKSKRLSGRSVSLAALRALTAGIVLITGSFVATAQDPPSTPAATPAPPTAIDKEIERLKKEKERAELEKAIREAQPQTSIEPLKGDTTADDKVVIETQIVTYNAMSDVAERIGSQIHQKFGDAKSIAVYNADELQNLKHYRAASPVVNGRIESLKQKYWDLFGEMNQDTELRDTSISSITVTTNLKANSNSNLSIMSNDAANLVNPVVGAASAISTGLKAGAELMALLRTETDIKGKAVTVEESAMVAETFRALRNKFVGGIDLYYPAMVSPEAKFECPGADEFCSPLLRSLAGLYGQKELAERRLLQHVFSVTSEFERTTARKSGDAEAIAALAKKIDELNLDRLKAELDKPWTPAQVAKFETFIQQLEARKAAAVADKTAAETRLGILAKQKNMLESLQGLNQQTDEMVAALAKPDDKTGRSELAILLRAENINKIMEENGYWLEFKAISAGGNNRTRKNLFRYFSGAKIDHSGGVIIEWALYDRNGASVESNKDSSYPGYFAPKEIQSGKLKDAVEDPSRPQTPAVAKSGNQ